MSARRRSGCLVLLGALFWLLLFPSLTPGQGRTIHTSSYAAFGRAASQVGKEGVQLKSAGDFLSRRLIVKTTGGSFDGLAYGADTVVAGPENHYLLCFLSREDAKKAWEEIGKRGDIEYAEPEAIAVNADAGNVMSTSLFTHYSWGVEKIGAGYFADYIRKKNVGSIMVAVLDSGMDSPGSDHPLLKGKKLSGYNFVDGNTDTSDLNGHGTHVAGIIADCMQGLDVSLLPVKVMNTGGYGYEMDVASGVRYAADRGAKVINMSIECQGTCSYVKEAILYAVRRGSCVVVAAGNKGWDVANDGISNIASAIVVGAVDAGGNIASFSNYGSTIDVAAPGVDIRSAYIGPEQYTSLSGTSMAAPHVSAVAAMYRLAYPSKRPEEIEELLKQNVTDMGAVGWDPYYGAGIPNLLPLCSVSDGSQIQVSLSSSSLQMKVGSSYKLKTELYPLGSTAALTWKSSNAKVASVSGGTVKALKVGSAVIEVSTGTGASASCKVTVKKAEVSPASVRLGETVCRIAAGQTHKISAAVLPLTAVNRTLTWTTSDAKVATVSAGQVTAKKAGYVTITASTANGKSASCTVHVYQSGQTMGEVKALTGTRHTMAVAKDGTLWGWGENSEGQLGDGTLMDQLRPVPVLTGVKSVSTCTSGTVAVTKDGTLFASGKLPCIGSSSSLFVPVLSGVSNASLGEGFLAVKMTNGSMYLYGEPAEGSVGAGTKMSPTSPILLAKGVTELSAAYHHMAFVKSSGKAWAFGGGLSGQLGIGRKINLPLPGTSALSKVSKVAAGYAHTVFLRTDGTLWACGNNKKGQLGDGTATNRVKAVKVAKKVKDVVCGYNHTLILKTDGTVWAAGYGVYGQLGTGNGRDQKSFVQVAKGAVAIGAGSYSSFYVSRDGEVFACGMGTDGELGTGALQNTKQFTAVKR